MYEKQSRNTNRSTDTIASFLLKTYEILEHPEYERMISWDKSNVGFIIHDVVLFTRQILPKYFRHSNFSSFVRQLNMYDFHKVKQENQSLVFKNPLFCKGQQQNLKFIRRKAAKKVGGQRRQHISEKNEVQNQKYQNLLKGFKKSLETEINQSSLFYERSIQLIRDFNDSNLKKLNYIQNLYLQKTQTTEQPKDQDTQKKTEKLSQKQIKETIIQIPKEFLDTKQVELKQFTENKSVRKQRVKTLNIDNVMLLKQEVYKSLGIYQTWLHDYLENQKKKIKYVNGYRQQLIKCRETRIAESQMYQDLENGAENSHVNPQQQMEKMEERVYSRSQAEKNNQHQKFEYREFQSLRKMESINVNDGSQNESQPLNYRIPNKAIVSAHQAFEQTSNQKAKQTSSFAKVLSLNQKQFQSKLFSAFSNPKNFEKAQQKSKPSSSLNQDDQIIYQKSEGSQSVYSKEEQNEI